MLKNKIWLFILLIFLVADPASAWFWDKKEVKVPEVKANSSQTASKKGINASLKEVGRDFKDFFKGLGKGIRRNSQEVPGKTKKESRAIGKSLKESGKEIVRESKKIPGSLKNGTAKIGKSFKKFGKDIKNQ